ncbi:MAG TPA: DNA replication/repair protein RecF [Candidatus Wallbacteria bacterium]|nr:DNA replication/repair protein RecF [Candidatus Wallbacteria bacterium]
MQVLSVHLINFRNIMCLEIALSPGINLFYGMNGQGKTNILESVEILSTTRSDRAFKEAELVNHNEESALVSGRFLKNSLDFDISVNYYKNRKKTCVKNGKNTTADSIFGSVNIVKFFPKDAEIITGAPANRRRYADMEISLTDRAYYTNYKNYIKLIESRNAVLKQMSELQERDFKYGELMDLIESYDELLPDAAYGVYRGRLDFLKEIALYADRTHRSISSNREKLDILYHCSVNENTDKSMNLTENLFKQRLIFLLKKNLKNDIIRKLTTVGPHKDDIEFLINGTPAKNFGSTGQIKTLAVSLKLAQIDYVFNKTGDYPVLLIDDMTSEFDAERLFNIIKSISADMQVLISSTDNEIFKTAFGGQGINYFKVSGGAVVNN